MDNYHYKVVESNEDVCENEKFIWKYFLRQLFVASGVWSVFFITGVYMGAPTVVIPQLRREANSTEFVTDEMASWISSGMGYGSIPWNFVLPVLAVTIGRKIPSVGVHISTVIASIIFYYSKTPIHLLTFEILYGFAHSGVITISVVIIAEYTSPKYRGIFLTIKSATLHCGIWASNAIGTFFHWRYISVFGFICSLYTLTAFFWPESPLYLASKGKYEECKVVHRWLKGNSKNAEKELDKLIMFQKELNRIKEPVKIGNFVVNLYKQIVSEDFYKPIIVIALLVSTYVFSGKLVCSIYAIDVIKKITNSESAAYAGMLILDGATVISMYVGCSLSRVCKRRSLLLNASALSIFFLFSISLYLYLISLSILVENTYVCIALLIAYSFSVSCGPTILSTSLYAELTPMKYKSLSLVVISFIFATIWSIVLKLAPLVFRTFKMHGTFLFYGLSMSIFLMILYKYMPETKDKTLQEIEDYFQRKNIDKGNRRKSVTLTS